ncbi:MAG: Mfa1 fimbrilin C-terminal domain-containing protein [Prevotella sp.]|nr:Mfa1 fimbrilin C-terminal domain-containing protein [Prevotella sp.]
MKLNKFLLAVLAAASLTACSDSTDVEKGNGAQWNSDGTGYVSLSLNLPTKSTGMRAANDQFEDGTYNEYKVDKAILVLFGSAADKSENDATFLGAYSLPSTFSKNDSDNPNQITAVSKVTRKINKTDVKKVYAYVILNPTSDFEGGAVTSTDYTKTDETDLMINSTPVTGTTTFGTFKGLIIKNFQDASKNFVMTNAPLADKDGKVEVMSQLDVSCIKSTAADAAAHPAAAIYVERAAAKVTLKSSVTTMSTNIEGRKTFNVKVLGWKLDNTNTEAHATRNVDADYMNYEHKSVKRFYGTNPVATTDAAGNSLTAETKRYRTYWAHDVNYAGENMDKLSKNNNLYDAWRTDKKEVTIDDNNAHPAYCFENTFDVAHMTFDNTTRAIVAVQIGDDATDHYMYNNDIATYKACGTGNDDMKSDLLAKINTLPAVQDLGNATSVTLNTAPNGTSCTITSVNVTKAGGGSTTIDNTNNSDVLGVITSYFGTISIYKNAIAYYPVRIKHFGDDLTPWNNNEDTTLPSAANIYPDGTLTSAVKYLGRYGVLRNNWYELNVTGIQNIGTSDIPERGTTTDDTIESYISVTINVFSWAKRQQDVILQ